MYNSQNCYIPDIDLSDAIENLKRRKKDIIRYDEIMKLKDNPEDPDFQKKYDAFYRVRRNAEWREIYFDIMSRYQEMSDPSFEEILLELHQRTNRIEASFTSKLLATIDPYKPIWDSKVLSVLKLEMDKDPKKSRLQKTVELYEKICEWYQCFIKSNIAAEWIKVFDREFPEFMSFSSTKKIDFILWATDTYT